MYATPYPMSWIIFILDLEHSYICKNVRIPMGTNCVSPVHVADLLLYYYERDFMDSLYHDNQADVNTFTRYLCDLSNIDTGQSKYPSEMQADLVWDYGKDFSCYHLPFVWDHSDFGSHHLSFDSSSV